MAEPNVVVRRTGDMAEIVLNRPAKLNAMSLAWMRDLHDAVTGLTGEDLAVVVVRGEGRSFCSGLDLDMMAEQGMPPEFFPLQEEAFRALERLPALVFAQIHGHCLGGGLQLALACDIRIACEDAVLGLPAALEGLPPGMSTWRLPRFVGLGRALRLSLSGEHVSASEALAMGLVDHVLPADGFADAASEVVAMYGQTPRRAAAGIKEITRSAFDVDFDGAYQRTREIIAECLDGREVADAKRLWATRRAARDATG